MLTRLPGNCRITDQSIKINQGLARLVQTCGTYYEGCRYRSVPRQSRALALLYHTVTGASGVLGSAVFSAFKEGTVYDVKGLAYSRTNGELVKIDLTNEDEVVAFFEEYRPDCDYVFQVCPLCLSGLRLILNSQGSFIALQKGVQMWPKRWNFLVLSWPSLYTLTDASLTGPHGCPEGERCMQRQIS